MSGGFSTEQFADEAGNKNPNRMIPLEKAMEIIAGCESLGVAAIQFTGGGEPTVHRDHLALFSAAQGFGLETSLVTNGVILRDGWEQVYPKMAWVRVSIDASSPDEYAAVRRVSPLMYGKALSNLARMAAEIDKAGSSCLLGAGYVITRENWENMNEGIQAIKATGCRYVRLSAMFSEKGSSYYEGLHDAIRFEIGRAKELEGERFKVVDLFGDRIHDLEQHAPDYEFCGYQQFNMYIGGNLKIYRCCTTAYTKHGEVGDLKDQTLVSWFHSQKKKDSYREFDARSCMTCQFNGKNRVINYLVGEPPLHVEFV
jgi:MoaA/NifB/PqqE/SkfB family radical SAM enzyme